jgi:hypothetical protein
MAIKTGKSQEPIDVAVTDTTIYLATASTRITVSGLSCVATAACIITFYESTDETSAAGKVLDSVVFTEAGTKDASHVIPHGLDGTNLIAKSDVAVVNAKLTYSYFDGADV